MKRRLSRRDLLKLTGAMAGAGVVSACTPRILTTSPSPSSSPTPPPARYHRRV
jgi:hypothetical protein